MIINTGRSAAGDSVWAAAAWKLPSCWRRPGGGGGSRDGSTPRARECRVVGLNPQIASAQRQPFLWLSVKLLCDSELCSTRGLFVLRQNSSTRNFTPNRTLSTSSVSFHCEGKFTSLFVVDSSLCIELPLDARDKSDFTQIFTLTHECCKHKFSDEVCEEISCIHLSGILRDCSKTQRLRLSPRPTLQQKTKHVSGNLDCNTQIMSNSSTPDSSC